jgi:hypothetical protein
MAQLAQLDPASGLVIGWYDPDNFQYKNLPEGLIEVPDNIWSQRTPGPWKVDAHGNFSQAKYRGMP